MAVAPAAWLPLQETASEFRTECAALEQFVEKLLRDLDYLRLELEHKADELEETQQRLDERSRQLEEQRTLSAKLAQHLEHQETQFDLTLGELRELRQQMAQNQQEAVERDSAGRSTSEEVLVLQQRLVQLEAERDELRRHASMAAAPQMESRPAWLGELDELRLQLVEAQSDLSSAIQRAADANAASAAANVHAAAPPAEWSEERNELETELDLVRSRAAELQEIVDAQRRELADSRDEMSAELKQLRRLIEQQAERAVKQTVTAPVPAAADEGAAAEGEDPVMNSVMAQFAKLQKDVAQRRKKK
jgi:DNA repair exonuclease SbcCD ATPase subunit